LSFLIQYFFNFYIILCNVVGVIIENGRIHLTCYLQNPMSDGDVGDYPLEQTKSFSPVELSTIVLKYLKRSAEEYLQRKPICSCPPDPNSASPSPPTTSTSPVYVVIHTLIQVNVTLANNNDLLVHCYQIFRELS
jgi:hypothetical protein